MKKNRINAFTLVEMLIVIVIIGILIAALMPRMQSAQGRARDVARKNDLAQIQTAIVTSQQDKGNWPGMAGTYCKTEDLLSDNAKEAGVTCDNNKFKGDAANDGIVAGDISQALLIAGMSSVPKDPLGGTEVSGLGKGSADTTIASGQYAYMVTKRNGTDNGGFVLMAKTEIEGGSNRIVCQSGVDSYGSLSGGFISKGADLKKVNPCTSFQKGNDCVIESNGTCKYRYDGELRYILVY